jgi:hypothetical protein
MCTVTTGLHLVGKLPGRLDYVEKVYVVIYCTWLATYNLPGAPSAKIFGTYDVTSDFVYTPHFSFKFRIDKTYKGFLLRSAVGSVSFAKAQ